MVATTSIGSPWLGVTRNSRSPLLAALPSSSMRHLLETGALSAKEMAASISDAPTAVKMAGSFIGNPLVTRAPVLRHCRQGGSGERPHRRVGAQHAGASTSPFAAPALADIRAGSP